jgi:quercetin dioxygenase-like cupin family protein
MQTVIAHIAPAATPIPGVAHATWAGQAEGLSQFSVWRQSLAAGAATPPHRHDCDEVVLCQSGHGTLYVGDQALPFAAPCTLVLPRQQPHQIVNDGETPMEIVGVFGGTPVGTWLPDGSALALPWRT